LAISHCSLKWKMDIGPWLMGNFDPLINSCHLWQTHLAASALGDLTM